MIASVKKPCAHCHRRAGTRRWGLCWACSLDPYIRRRARAARGSHPSDFSDDRRGAGRSERDLLPCCPTQAFPGSEEKVAVLAGRWERGERLHHPLDRTCFPDRVAMAGGFEEDTA